MVNTQSDREREKRYYMQKRGHSVGENQNQVKRKRTQMQNERMEQSVRNALNHIFRESKSM